MCRRCARALPAGLLVVLLCFAGVAPVQAQTGGERALRLGMYHPRPRLCLADEPTQRDLRVLRLAYGVMRRPEARLAWPWFYRAYPVAGASWLSGVAAGLAVALDTEALWAQPVYRLEGGHPKLPEAAAADRLYAWREWAAARLDGARAADAGAMAQLVGPMPATDPFLASRLAGSRLLPFALGRNGVNPRDLCRDWPAGVTLEAGEPPLAYVLRSEAGLGTGGEPFRLFAYRERADLWRAYFRGRLDALLLEAADFDGRLGRYRASQLGSWGVKTGTQQVVLRFAPDVAATLGVGGRRALSVALPRHRLAQVQGPGRFSAPRGFLAPVLEPGAVQPAPELAWDSLRARRTWLERDADVGELRLAVLAHPVLERLAQRMQAQWNRTLNVRTRVQAWSIDQFAGLLEAGEADLLLDVVDLDDGSLQDLWLAALREADTALGPPRPETLAHWEAVLREAVPYLPVLGNVHAVLLRRNAPESLLARVCPGCVPAASPSRLAPEPTEPANPQG